MKSPHLLSTVHDLAIRTRSLQSSTQEKIFITTTQTVVSTILGQVFTQTGLTVSPTTLAALAPASHTSSTSVRTAIFHCFIFSFFHSFDFFIFSFFDFSFFFAYCCRLDSLAGWHGDDFHTEGEPDALAEVLPRRGPGASAEGTILRRILRWSEEGVHMAPDAKHVENLANLLEVKGAKPSPTPSSRGTGRGQRDVLELLSAAEATVFRRGTGIALYLGPDRFDLQFATKELAQDMQTPGKLSMLRLRRFVRYLLGAADEGSFFAYQDEPNTVQTLDSRHENRSDS